MLRPRGFLVLTVGMSKGGTANMPASTGRNFVIVENIGVVKCYIDNLSGDICRRG
jgi:hypothetical protein